MVCPGFDHLCSIQRRAKIVENTAYADERHGLDGVTNPSCGLVLDGEPRRKDGAG